ncbi:fungal-specific transcription factor domain-containing protein [Aspergillus insuetus]
MNPLPLVRPYHGLRPRQQRASQACKACRTRKVRCDAATYGLPCTNCRALCTTCLIPDRKRRKRKGHLSESSSMTECQVSTSEIVSESLSESVSESMPTLPSPEQSPDKAEEEASNVGPILRPMSKSRAGRGNNGRICYLGPSSNICSLDARGTVPSDMAHYPLFARSNGNVKTTLEYTMLQRLGAFLLPTRAICDAIIQAFFQWVFPILPILDRVDFMEKYQDPKNPPSILLLQAVLLAGTRACRDPRIIDKTGSTAATARIFYERASSLFEFNYEEDRTIITQALILISWYWDDPREALKDPFYWTRNAISVAYSAGLHRSVADSQIQEPTKRLRSRIWWTLFTRDRSIAAVYGRPMAIHLEDSDVAPLARSDFFEADRLILSEVEVEYFSQYVRLCEIMGDIVTFNNRASARSDREISDIVYYDMALTNWLDSCPPSTRWTPSKHEFWPALLHITYCSMLCQLHRLNCFKTSSLMTDDVSGTVDVSYDIALDSATVITTILQRLDAKQEMQYVPAFTVYAIYSALSMHIDQSRKSLPLGAVRIQQRIEICMHALRQVSQVVYKIFDSMVGDKAASESQHLDG